MKNMKFKWLVLLFLSVLSRGVFAAPTLLCSLERSKYDNLNSDYRQRLTTQVETKRFKMEFKLNSSGQYDFYAVMRFEMLPNHETAIQIIESVRDGKVSWRSLIETKRRDDGTSLKVGWPHRLRNNATKTEWNLNCAAYDSFDANYQPSDDSRENLRTDYLGGPSVDRDYKDDVDPVDAFDILNILSQHSPKLRDAMDRLARAGYGTPVGLIEGSHATRISIDDGDERASEGLCPTGTRTCITETITVTRYYYSDNQVRHLFVKAKLIRIKGQRRLGWVLVEEVEIPRLAAFQYGGANTSGGRVMPR